MHCSVGSSLLKDKILLEDYLIFPTVFKPELSDIAVFNHNLKGSNACEF